MTAASSGKSAVYDIVAGADGFSLVHNDLPLKTPAGQVFLLPTRQLAEALAEEWRTQSGKKPGTVQVPLTQLAATAIDIVAKQRGKIVEGILAYAQSELLCHVSEEPKALADRQHKTWQPILDWCALRFDALLQMTAGIMPVAQAHEALKALHGAVESYDKFHLAGLQEAVHICGSLVLGLALAERHLDAAQAFEASELEASFQIEKWGDDPASSKRRESIRRDLEACQTWFRLLCRTPEISV